MHHVFKGGKVSKKCIRPMQYTFFQLQIRNLQHTTLYLSSYIAWNNTASFLTEIKNLQSFRICCARYFNTVRGLCNNVKCTCNHTISLTGVMYSKSSNCQVIGQQASLLGTEHSISYVPTSFDSSQEFHVMERRLRNSCVQNNETRRFGIV